MAPFNIYEAKTQLSKLIRRVRAGQEVIIADAGTPVAKLVPIEQPKTARVLGGDRGKIWVAPDALDPLAGEDLAVWDGVLFPEAPKPPKRPLAGRPVASVKPAAARIDEALARYARVHLDARRSGPALGSCSKVAGRCRYRVASPVVVAWEPGIKIARERLTCPSRSTST